VNTFLDHSSLLTASTSLDLVQIKEESGSTIISLQGDAQFANTQDSVLFWEALDITLARNYKHHNFAIEWLHNEKPLRIGYTVSN
ncbi:MAG: hypothetical protein AAGD05_16245, partial [Bacteroidota bacterium]